MQQGGWDHQNCLSLHRICLKGTTTCGECAQTAWTFFLGEFYFYFFKEHVLRGFHCILGTTGMCHQAHNITPTITDRSQTHTQSTKKQRGKCGSPSAAEDTASTRFTKEHAVQKTSERRISDTVKISHQSVTENDVHRINFTPS